MTAALDLDDGAWRLRVLPERGGSLAECAFRGQTILQPVRQMEGSAWPSAELCYYPLVPFSNRIRHGVFAFEGREIRLAPTLSGYPHALHGQGWQASWSVTHRAANACTIALDHAASDRWPWDYRATQTFEIAASALAVTLTLRNESTTRMPAGLGFHPCFPRPESARLAAVARQLWLGAAEEFPRVAADVPPGLDFARPRAVRDARGLDHCYSGWQREATIDWSDAPLRVLLAADEPLAHFMIYVPRDRDFFCFEPATHVVDACNFPRGDAHAAAVLEPSQELAATMTLTIDQPEK